MKSLLTYLLFLGIVSVDALKIDGTSQASTDLSHMVTIDLQKTEYKPERLV